MLSVYMDLEYLTVNWRMILQWILKKQGVRFWNGFVWLRAVTTVGLHTTWK
jgi:hypothetical protein